MDRSEIGDKVAQVEKLAGVESAKVAALLYVGDEIAKLREVVEQMTDTRIDPVNPTRRRRNLRVR